MNKFVSLTHARAVRDRLAKEAVQLGADETKIDTLCRAPMGFRLSLLSNWSTRGLDYESLVALADAIEFIASAERAAVRGK